MMATYLQPNIFISCLVLALTAVWVPSGSSDEFREQLLRPNAVPQHASFTASCHLYLRGHAFHQLMVQRVTTVELRYTPMCSADNRSFNIAFMNAKEQVRNKGNYEQAHPHWKVSFFGDGASQPDSLTRSMRIVLTVSNAVHEDSGHYSCFMAIKNRNNQDMFSEVTEYMKVGWGEPLLSPTQIDQGDSFKVTCTLTSAQVPPGTRQLRSLQLTFWAGHENCRAPGKTTLARYDAIKRNSWKTSQKGWDIKMTGQGAPDQRCHQRIEMEVKKADLGRYVGDYECVVSYTWPDSRAKTITEMVRDTLRIKHPPLPLLRKTEVNVGESIITTCDLQRVTLYPRVSWVSLVHLKMCTPCGCKDVGYLAQPQSGRVRWVKDEFPGRKWWVTTSVSRSYPRNFAVHLVVDRDIQPSDQAVFHCMVNFTCFGLEQISLSRTAQLIVKAARENIIRLQQLVLLVICDASTLGLPADKKFISKIEIFRQTDSERNFSKIAGVRTYGSDSRLDQSLPPARHWLLNPVGDRFPEPDFADNRESLRLILRVQDFRCADRGNYMCRLTVPCMSQGKETWGAYSRVQRFDPFDFGFCRRESVDKIKMRAGIGAEDTAERSHSDSLPVLYFFLGVGVTLMVLALVSVVVNLRKRTFAHRPTAALRTSV